MPKKRQQPSMVLKVLAEEQDDGTIQVLKDESGKIMERLAPNRAMRRANKAIMRRSKNEQSRSN
jgi:hypothetical protein